MKKIKNYIILDHLVDGGMAKISRALQVRGESKRIVIIKTIRTTKADDQEYIDLFLDETRNSMELHHPNISQVYDCGNFEGENYYVLEYIHGVNLKELADRFNECSEVLTIPDILYMITKSCEALHYFHNLQHRFSGQDYGFIHRDISPHNIMINFDGEIKLIDFGISKTPLNEHQTEINTIKGKLSYLAPEVLNNGELTQKYDQFAIGLVMWELISGNKLFNQKGDIAVLKAIKECQVRKPKYNEKAIDEELCNILLKSLSKDPMDRYDNVDQFNRDLTRYLFQNYPEYHYSALKEKIQRCFKDTIDTDKKLFEEYNNIDISKFNSDDSFQNFSVKNKVLVKYQVLFESLFQNIEYSKVLDYWTQKLTSHQSDTIEKLAVKDLVGKQIGDYFLGKVLNDNWDKKREISFLAKVMPRDFRNLVKINFYCLGDQLNSDENLSQITKFQIAQSFYNQDYSNVLDFGVIPKLNGLYLVAEYIPGVSKGKLIKFLEKDKNKNNEKILQSIVTNKDIMEDNDVIFNLNGEVRVNRHPERNHSVLESFQLITNFEDEIKELLEETKLKWLLETKKIEEMQVQFDHNIKGVPLYFGKNLWEYKI